jgi:hypothetical protein
MNKQEEYSPFFGEYPDINGKNIEVGMIVVDWCTGELDVHSDTIKIESMDQLDQLWVNALGLLEVVE